MLIDPAHKAFSPSRTSEEREPLSGPGSQLLMKTMQALGIFCRRGRARAAWGAAGACTAGRPAPARHRPQTAPQGGQQGEHVGDQAEQQEGWVLQALQAPHQQGSGRAAARQPAAQGAQQQQQLPGLQQGWRGHHGASASVTGPTGGGGSGTTHREDRLALWWAAVRLVESTVVRLQGRLELVKEGAALQPVVPAPAVIVTGGCQCCTQTRGWQGG